MFEEFNHFGWQKTWVNNSEKKRSFNFLGYGLNLIENAYKYEFNGKKRIMDSVLSCIAGLKCNLKDVKRAYLIHF